MIPPRNSTFKPLICPKWKPQITPQNESMKVVMAMIPAGYQMFVCRNAILMPTAKASILVAMPKVNSILGENEITQVSFC